MHEYFELDKDEMIYSSKIFYSIIPIFIVVRVFIFYLFEVLFRLFSKKFSSLYAAQTDSNKLEYTSKATSIFHAILVTILCIPHTLTDIIYRESNKDLAFGITKRRVDVLLWTLAYLVYDSWSMIRMYGKKIEKAMALHHIVCISAFVLGLYLNVGTVFMASFIINEISTPFLHFRWYFSRMKKRDSLLATINNLIFALTYFIFRGIWNTYVVIVLCTAFYDYRDELHHSSVPFWMIACLPPFAISHLFLNYYWLYLIIAHLVHPKPASTPTEEEDSPHTSSGSHLHHSTGSLNSNRDIINSTELEGISISQDDTERLRNYRNSRDSMLSTTSSRPSLKENTPLLSSKATSKKYTDDH